MKVILVLAALLCCCGLGAGQVYSCPPVSPDDAGLCSEDCSDDSDCSAPYKCCSNGCGHVCTSPTLTPYHPPPYECPAPSDDVAGICDEACNATSCDSGFQCCSNGCGHTCLSICNIVSSTNQTLIGAYRPQCDDDDRFSTVQCHASTGYCWCVDPLSGEPRSELVRGTELMCSCMYNGETRSVGEVFRAIDGFNYCTCTVTGPQCSENKVFQSCPPVREDEAGICVAECTLDSECLYDTKCCYTGCGYSCTDPEVTPYIPLPTLDTCPPTNQVPCTLPARSCAQSTEDEEEEESSDDDSESSDGLECNEDTSMCCENDCGSSVCVFRTGPAPCKTARKIAEERNSTRDSMVGRFSPQCDFDGHFRPVQCHEHFCWCVDEHSGQPESDMVAFEHLDNLPCTKCVYDGRKYGYLAQFPSNDGCNTCTCVYDGVISCTEVACVEPEEVDLWDWWHSVLVYCVVAVVVLTLLVLALLVAVVITVKRNAFRHRRLKEAAVHFDSDMDAVYFKQGQDLTSVELKVPVEDCQEDGNHA